MSDNYFTMHFPEDVDSKELLAVARECVRSDHTEHLLEAKAEWIEGYIQGISDLLAGVLDLIELQDAAPALYKMFILNLPSN